MKKSLKKQALKRKKKHTGRKRNAENRNSIQKATKNNIIKAMEKQQDDGSNGRHSYNYENTYRQQQNNRRDMLVINLRM